MAEQLHFDLPIRTAQGREDFIVSDCNAHAVELVDRWPEWPGVAVCLVGPARSGRTHLLEVWRQRAGAVLIEGAELSETMMSDLLEVKAVALDNVDQIKDEEALFHLFNVLTGEGGHLLMTSQAPPSGLSLRLPDLQSRLMTALVGNLEEPDDALTRGLILKLFQDRQIRVSEDVVDFLVLRTVRSFGAVSALVASLDEKAMRERRRITIPFAREVLEGLSEGSQGDMWDE